ncbi:MAG: hypothetical protein GY913_09930 [Proteobacteria bacterium]|nr:hypothetical protein [Pseudomonadota bacterium]MCP4917231.1 hypothetical protein [Pseudomonadota bacterium]
MTMLLLLSCVYEPPVVGSADYPETVTLSGDVVLYNGAPEGVAPVGHVLVYAADDLPPPSGFGSPIDLATISPDAWGTAGTGGVEGVVSAPWSITGLPDGDYVLSALIDNDNDFSPFFTDFSAGATCGDQLGAFVASASSQAVLPVTVAAPDHLDGISILAGDALPFERPGFTLGQMAGATMPQKDLEKNLLTIGTFEWELVSTGIDHPHLTLNDPLANDCPTRFTVMTVDADGDGVADPHALEAAAALGAVTMWPRVLLKLVADENGDEPEQSYLSEALIDFRADDFQIPRALAYGSDWVIPSEATPNVPYSTSSLPLVWTGKGVPIAADGSLGEEVSGGDLPAGVWSIIVMNHTGQLWSTPNGLSSEELWGSDAIASQGVAIVSAGE